ncbi:hypothetical protein [Streptomyces sp. NPDC002851]
MTATTSTTFEQLIHRHTDLLATMLDKGDLGEMTAAEFIDHVDSAVHLLAQSGIWASDREEMEAAHLYLSNAYQLADDDPAKTVLLGKADGYLNGFDETDWIC